jgi:CubicO group peptidase (beta-lactamase class C family)
MTDRAGAAVRNLWPHGLAPFVFPKMLAVMALAVMSLAGATPYATAAAGPAADPIAARIDAELSTAYPSGGPGAAAIVVRDGKPILRKGYGMANVELGVPNAPDTVFRIGSMTKQFTAVAVLMLVQEGKIAFDDPLTKFLPNYPARGEKITIENLLTHTSGIRSYTEMPDFESNMRKDYTVPEMIDHFAKEPLDFPPGTQWHYDNSGYFLLGAVIEKASGMACVPAAAHPRSAEDEGDLHRQQ